MLILTRRTGESLMIGDDITVAILGVKGNQVRLGINAPKKVAVHREEIYERIRRETCNRSKDNGGDGLGAEHVTEKEDSLVPEVAFASYTDELDC